MLMVRDNGRDREKSALDIKLMLNLRTIGYTCAGCAQSE